MYPFYINGYYTTICAFIFLLATRRLAFGWLLKLNANDNNYHLQKQLISIIKNLQQQVFYFTR